VVKIVENLWVVGAPPNPTGEVDNAPPELQVTSLLYRLPPDVPAHNILQHCVNLSQGRCPAPDWKYPHGRPRKTWIQQVEDDHR